MSFKVTLMYNASPRNMIGKALKDKAYATGALKENCDILAPVITIDSTLDIISGANYAYIEEFNRYYFITGVEIVNNMLFNVSMAVDVLETYKDEILALSCITKRQENTYNLYLNDGVLKSYHNTIITTRTFPNAFSSREYVLAVAGGAE